MITPANTGVLGALTGNTSDGKVFDSVEYENALKDSGYTDEEARAYWSPRRDPYSQESISDFVSSQVPKVSIRDNDITISAPKDVLDSPLVSQIKTELGSLKGMNLNNPEVKNAIDKLNEEIRTSFSSNIDQALGWTQEEYDEYQRAIQATSSSNPMSSKDLFAWGPEGKAIVDEKGKIIMKTPSEWVEYWQGNYTPEERTELFKKSLQSSKPRERVMALFMAGPGSTRPVYGYTEGERLGQVFNAAASEMGKFPEGLVRLLGEDNNTKRLESLQKKTNIPVESLRKFNVGNEDTFNSKIANIVGRAWSDLTDDEKAFVLEVGVSKGDSLLPEWQQRALSRNDNGDAIELALSDDGEVSKEAIRAVLEGSSFDKYKEVRDNYDTWQGYDDWTKEDDLKMAENEIWSGLSSQAGRVIGTIGRFLWEDAVVRGLTGGISLESITNPNLVTGAAAKEIASKGISMNRLSDKIAGSYETGAGIVGWLGKHNISPSSATGKRLIEFGANLVGTIPEDILQTAVDNVVTYNPDENANLLDPTQMAESFRNNLIVMSLFNAARVGFNQIRLNRLAKKIAKNADLNQPLNVDGLVSDADDLARAAKKGQDIFIDNGVVSVDDGAGGRKILNNITPEQADMAFANSASLKKSPKIDFDQIVETDPSGNIDFDEYKRAKIVGEDPSLEASSALTKYQNEDPVSMDALARYLREGGRTAENPNLIIKEVDDGLSKAFTHSVGQDGAVTYSGLTDTELIRRFRDANVGDKVTIDTYLSTSVKPNVAQGFANEMPEKIILRVYAPDGTPIAYMPQDMPYRNTKVMESELLYPDGKNVEVVGKYNGDELGNGYDGMTVIDVIMDNPDGTSPKVDFGNRKMGGDLELNKANLDELADTDNIKTAVEIETADGPMRVEVPDYRPRGLDDTLKIKPEPTQASLNQYHMRGMEAIMDEFKGTHLPELQTKFGDVQTSDFDWVLYNTKKGLTPDQIIGTMDPTTNRTITQNMIDAMKWWQDQPFTKDLRMASRSALGYDDDFNLLGYLPHTTYDPTNVSFEEALNGRGSLWQTFTGSSMLDDNNNYKGFGGSFEDRYRTFASNMLWDAKTKDVAVAKIIEEAQMEGIDLSPEQAVKVAEGAESIQNGVDNATSTKDVVTGLTTDGDTDFAAISKKTAEDAQNSRLGQSMHDNWGEVYFGKDSSKVTKQRSGVVNSLDTQGNFLRNTQTADGSMYDNGAADIVYSYGNATDLISRYMDPNDASATNLREAIVDYYTQHGRPKKYAEVYADKAMSRLGEVPGTLTKSKAISSLANSMKWEAWSRLRRWLVRANYSQFNTSTKKYIDQFLFNHMQMESIKNNPKISRKLTKALDVMTGLRYRALFYGNIKNALLQTSELNRYFSAFKWGDVAQMAKRLATDDGFRARVDTYVDVMAPKTSRLDADLYGKFSNIADNMDVEQNDVKFKDLGKKAKETADAIGLGPIEAAESFKNRMMIAGLVQEADRLGLSGDEALRHIRKRFERVALAADEMGRIGMSSNPLARTALFLQNFQIRELGMHLYNILDETDMAKNTPAKILNASKYLTKVLGAKLATTLILARLGYSASQTMGLDPFGLLENYNQMDKEDMNWVDQNIAGGLLTPFFSGGMTSLIADMYFMGRKAYEDSKQQTVSDEAEEHIDDTYGWKLPDGVFTWENMMEGAKNFIPGSVFAKRIGQMNELMNIGWATSATGNKMYTAPTDPINTALGYVFGRSATQNALQYNQNYGDDLLQTLQRFMPGRQWGEFDPIDTKNYSDWFKGDGNDLQQFNKGRYWFQDERDKILKEYQSAIENSYATSEEISEAQNNMNRKLDELYDQLERFVAAYEKKNGTITPNMVKQILNILNTGKNVVGETQEQRDARQLEDDNKALERYSQLGMSPVGTYTGPTESNPDKETKYQGSPQYRAAISGYYDNAEEAVKVLKLADEELAPIRKSMQNRLSYAYSTEDWDTLSSLQNEYLKQFDQVVAPIIATYGKDILSSTDVVNQLNDMLSTGTNKRSGNLIPSSMYARNKKGRYQSMPLERVDVGKWAQQRYSSDVFSRPTVRSYSTAEEDLEEIKNLSASGQPGRARARALELKVRVDNQERSLGKEDYQWLMNFLNKKGEQ